MGGISQGMQPLVSAAYGRGCSEEARRILRCALLTALLTAAVLYAVILLWAEPLAALFNRDGDPVLAAMARKGMRIYFAGFVGAGITMTISAYYSAAGRPQPGFFLSLLRGCLAVVPAVWLLSNWLGLTGVWLAVPAAESLSALAAGICLRRMGGKKSDPARDSVDIPTPGR